MRVAVVGARGFIGSHLSLLFRSRGVDVVALSSRDGSTFDPAGCIRDEALKIDKTIDAVVYLSQSPFYRVLSSRAGHVWSVNVASAVRVAEWARQCAASRFVLASSGSVYAPSFRPHREDDPLRRDDWYALSKVQAEEAVALFRGDMQVTTLRLFSVYGPGQRHMLIPKLIETVVRGQPVTLWPAPGLRDDDGTRLSMTYVEDVANTIAHVLARKESSVLNVAGDEIVSIRRMAELIGRHVGTAPLFQMADAPRTYDLLADTTAFTQAVPLQFRSFEDALVPTVDELRRSLMS